MAYVSRKCPNCGGDIQLDNKKKNGFCMHCGSRISREETIQTTRLDSSNQVLNLTRLGYRKYGEGMLKEANTLFKQAIMLDCNSNAAIFGEIISQHDIEKKVSDESEDKDKYVEYNIRKIGKEAILEVARDKDYIGESESGFKLALGVYLFELVGKANINTNQDDYEIIHQLFQTRAAIKSLDLINPQIVASWCTDEDSKNILLEYGTDVNSSDGYDPQKFITTCANAEITKILIEYGADISAKNTAGNTPLFLCCDPEVAKILIDNGADVNAENNIGKTPLFFCKEPKVAKILIEHGVDVNSKNNQGDTALHKNESSYSALQMAEILIKHGADVNIKNNDGNTPLLLCKSLAKGMTLINNGATLDENKLLDLCEGSDDVQMVRGYATNIRYIREQNKTKKEGCYIATAVYGSYKAPEVLVLRRFRDEVLSQSILGRIFIKFYYTISPAIARRLKDAKCVNGCIKVVLDKLVDNMEK